MSEAVSFTCPQGHQSTTSDFCDVCGEPITSSGAAPAAEPPVAVPAEGTPAGSAPGESTPAGAAPPSSLTLPPPGAAPTQECPNCGAENPADALFCEACGYDFTTGQLPSTTPPMADPGADWVAEVWIDPDWFASRTVLAVARRAGPRRSSPSAARAHSSAGPPAAAGSHPRSTARATAQSRTATRSSHWTTNVGRWRISAPRTARSSARPASRSRRLRSSPGNATSSPTTNACTSARGPGSWSAARPTTRKPRDRADRPQVMSSARGRRLPRVCRRVRRGTRGCGARRRWSTS